MRRPLLQALIAMAALAAPVLWFLWRSVPPSGVQVTPRFETTPKDDAPRPGPRVRTAAIAGADTDSADDEPLLTDAPTAPAKPPGRLLLHVVTEEGDEPIAGARVVLPTDDASSGAPTDEHGDVAVEIPMDERHPDAEDTWVGVVAPGRMRESVHVTVASGGEQRETVRMFRGFALDVFVHDAAGRPIPGCAISVTESGGCIKSELVFAARVTGADGRARVDGLPEDSPTEFLFTEARHAGRLVSRHAHDTRPLDVVLNAGGVVRGVVRDPGGAPVAGARVEAYSSSENGSGVVPEPVHTDESGRFEIGGLALGEDWSFGAFATGWIDSEGSDDAFTPTAEAPEGVRDLVLRPPARLEFELAFAAPHAPCSATLQVSGADDQTCPVPGTATFDVEGSTSVRFKAVAAGLLPAEATTEAKPGETQRVRVVFEAGVTVSGIVVDDLGAAVPGAEVQVYEDTGSPPTATTDAMGAFVAGALTPGDHQIRVRAPGRAVRTSGTIVAPKDDVRIVVPRDGRAALRLRLPDGAPRPATRRIHWNDYPNTADDDGPWTDGEIVRSLAPGKYLVDVAVPGYVAVQLADVEVAPDGHTDLGEIVLDPGLPLTGRVVDADGHGVAFVQVHVGEDLVRADKEGRFRVDHAALGPHVIWSSASPDFLEETIEVTLAADSPPVVLTLHRGSLLTVRLRGISKDERPFYFVQATPAEGAERDASLSLDDDGGDECRERVPAGPHRIEVLRADVVVATKTIDLREGVDVTVDIDVPATPK